MPWSGKGKQSHGSCMHTISGSVPASSMQDCRPLCPRGLCVMILQECQHLSIPVYSGRALLHTSCFTAYVTYLTPQCMKRWCSCSLLRGYTAICELMEEAGKPCTRTRRLVYEPPANHAWLFRFRNPFVISCLSNMT
jgi:hypothetical protein